MSASVTQTAQSITATVLRRRGKPVTAHSNGRFGLRLDLPSIIFLPYSVSRRRCAARLMVTLPVFRARRERIGMIAEFVPDMPISRRKTAAAYSQVRFLQDWRRQNSERCVGSVEPCRAP